MVPPAEINLRFLPGLGGPSAKMSASDKSTCIYVTDTIDEAKKKIKTAYTGGSPVLKYQQEHGGVPGVCSVFAMILFHVLDAAAAEEVRTRCMAGEQMCRDCKKIAMDGVEEVLREHQEAMKTMQGKEDLYFLKKPLRSLVQ
jgi:tryptophanyl-tRNA synthetase